MRSNKIGYYSEILVSNSGRDKASFDLIILGKNAKVKSIYGNWANVAKIPILPEPNNPEPTIYEVYILPDSNYDNFTITLSYNKPMFDFQQIDSVGKLDLSYRNTPEGNYFLIE